MHVAKAMIPLALYWNALAETHQVHFELEKLESDGRLILHLV